MSQKSTMSQSIVLSLALSVLLASVSSTSAFANASADNTSSDRPALTHADYAQVMRDFSQLPRDEQLRRIETIERQLKEDQARLDEVLERTQGNQYFRTGAKISVVLGMIIAISGPIVADGGLSAVKNRLAWILGYSGMGLSIASAVTLILTPDEAAVYKQNADTSLRVLNTYKKVLQIQERAEAIEKSLGR